MLKQSELNNSLTEVSRPWHTLGGVMEKSCGLGQDTARADTSQCTFTSIFNAHSQRSPSVTIYSNHDPVPPSKSMTHRNQSYSQGKAMGAIKRTQ
jgi:hypothetical protein